jgi:hypothetical protein
MYFKIHNGLINSFPLRDTMDTGFHRRINLMNTQNLSYLIHTDLLVKSVF